MKPKRFIITILAIAFVHAQSVAQNLIATGVSVMTVEKMVRDYMFGGNKSVYLGNIRYKGGFGAIGSYNAVGTPFGTTSGLVLSTGSVYMINGPFLRDTTSTDWRENFDFDIEGIYRADSLEWPPSPGPGMTPRTYDPAVIEFDVATPGSGLTFNYQFGSFEYDDTLHNDTSIAIPRDFGGILIQGKGILNGFDYKNLALITQYYQPPLPPNPTREPEEVPVNSYSVNNGPHGTGPCQKCDMFYDNTSKSGGAYPFTSMPGFTGVFTTSINVHPCDTYHVKVFVTDVGDGFMDSHFFVNVETVDPPTYEVVDKYKVGSANFAIDTIAFEDCDYAEIRIERYTNIGSAATTTLWYTGTAVPGVDYQPLPTTISFAVGQRTVIVPIYAKKTAPGTPNRTIVVNNLNEVCGKVEYSDKTYVLKKDILSFNLGPDTNLCEGQQIVLNATNSPPAEYYVWNDATGGPVKTVTKSGQYSVRARIGTCLRSDTINVNFKPLVKFNLGPDSSICFKDSLKLDPKVNMADTNIKFLWNDNTTKAIKYAKTTGNYRLRVSRLGCHTYDTVNVNVKTLPTVTLGKDTAFCYKGNPSYDIIATTDPFNEIYWNTGGKGLSTNVSTTGLYWIRVKANGCYNYDTINVTMTQTPPLNLRDTFLCEKYALKLRAPKNQSYTYLWNNGSTDSTITVYDAGTYIATVTNGMCVAKDTSVVTRKPAPKTNLGNDTALCTGQFVTLDAQSTDLVSYKWGGAGTGCGTNRYCTTSGTGNYIVTLTSLSNGCIGKDTLYFYAKPLPNPKLGPDTSICHFSEVTLTAQGPYDSLFWQDGSTDPTFTLDKPGLYWAKAYRDNCSFIDTVKVSTSPNAPPFTLSTDTGFCKGSYMTYDVSCPGCSYLWDDGSTIPIKTFKSSGVHSITITNQKCKRKEDVKIEAVIPASVFPEDTFMCGTTPLRLNNPIPGAGSLWWDNKTTTALSPVIQYPGRKVWLTVNNKGCKYTDTIEVKYVGDPVVDLGPDISSCSSAPLILDATNEGNTTYLWSNGFTGPKLDIKEAGDYTVSVTRCGTTVTDQIYVDYLNKNMTFFVPSAFTPGTDGLNDVLIPGGKVKEPSKYSFSVYNKWGQKVFETNDMTKGWDGTYNGVKQPGEVYIWTIDAYSDCYADPYYHADGNVTLLK